MSKIQLWEMPPFSNKSEKEKIEEYNRIEGIKKNFRLIREKYIKERPVLFYEEHNDDDYKDWHDDGYMEPDKPLLTPVSRYRGRSW